MRVNVNVHKLRALENVSDPLCLVNQEMAQRGE